MFSHTRTPTRACTNYGVDPCRQLRVPECLAEADSSCWGKEESWKEPGYIESACKFSPFGMLHVHFCQDLLPRKMEFWSSQIWKKKIKCFVGFRSWVCSHAVCWSLWATSQSTRDILHYETVGIFCDKRNVVESFLSEARQHPEVPCEALKFSSQLPASFLEEVVPVGMLSLQKWKDNKIGWLLLVPSGNVPRNLKTVYFF